MIETKSKEYIYKKEQHCQIIFIELFIYFVNYIV
jgi:hypothetical protein